jgi:hypothetical protein
LVIFVDRSADSVVGSGAEGVEIDDLGWQRFVWCGAGQCHVRPAGVVAGFMVAQDAA